MAGHPKPSFMGLRYSLGSGSDLALVNELIERLSASLTSRALLRFGTKDLGSSLRH